VTRTGSRILAALLLLLARAAAAQQPASSELTVQAAVERALSANPAIAAARLARAVNTAGLEVARERLNPEFSVEFEREAPKHAFGLAVPLELGGKRDKRVAVERGHDCRR
jgi:cobalt-zinc-cadmium efflux system outer membrane protein